MPFGFGGPKPKASPQQHVYKERSAVNFQEEELARLRVSQAQANTNRQGPGPQAAAARQPAPQQAPARPGNVYKERSAVNFQEEELKRLQATKQSPQQQMQPPQQQGRPSGGPYFAPAYSDPSSGMSSTASSPPPSTYMQQPRGGEESREQLFDRYKSELEEALIAGHTEKIIEGYRNLGQHFMQGKTLAEHQAAKQMFEKALEHAGVQPVSQTPSPDKRMRAAQQQQQHAQSMDSRGSSFDMQEPPQNRPPPPAAAAQRPAAPPPPGARTVVLNRQPLPGMMVPPDGLVGVGFSFETLPDGEQIISSMAATGSAAMSGQMFVGDELISVDGCRVRHFAAPDIIGLVKGQMGSQVTLVLQHPDRPFKPFYPPAYPNPPPQEHRPSPPRSASPPPDSTRGSERAPSPPSERVPPPPPPAAPPPPPPPALPPSQPLPAEKHQDPPLPRVSEERPRALDDDALPPPPPPAPAPAPEPPAPKPTPPAQPELRTSPVLVAASPAEAPSALGGQRQEGGAPVPGKINIANSPWQNQLKRNSLTPMHAGAPPQDPPPPVPVPPVPVPKSIPRPAPAEQAVVIPPQPPPLTTPAAHTPPTFQPPPFQAPPFQAPSFPAPHNPTQPYQQQYPPAQPDPAQSAYPYPHTPMQPPMQQPPSAHAPYSMPPPPQQQPYMHPPAVGNATSSPMQPNGSPPTGGKKRGKRVVFTRDAGRGMPRDLNVGVGINITCNERGLGPFAIKSLEPNSPAALCGQVHPGDLLYSVDGKRVRDLSLQDVLDMIKGPSGTQVTIVFQTHFQPGSQGHVSGQSKAASPGSFTGHEVRVQVYGCEDVPGGWGTLDGSDPLCCLSVLSISTSPESAAQLAETHQATAQACSYAPRQTMPSARTQQELVVKDFKNLGGAREPLSGQPVALLFTLHQQGAGVRGGDTIGHTLVNVVRVGPPSEHWLPLVDASGAPIGPDGGGKLHLRVWYGQSKAGGVEREPVKKATEMRARREKAQGRNRDQSPKEVGALTQEQLVMRSTQGLRGQQMDPLLPAVSPSSKNSGDIGNVATLWVKAYGGGLNGVGSENVRADIVSARNDPGRDLLLRELQDKDQAIVELEKENRRLKERVKELSQLTDMSIHTSHNTMRALREEIADKTAQLVQVQAALDEVYPKQLKLETQLASSQQLVRGSLLQHQKFEAQTQEQAEMIARLQREKEWALKEVHAIKDAESKAPTLENGPTQTLEQLVDYERKRFKQALADERLRFAEALEREQQQHRLALKEQRAEAHRKVTRALTDSGRVVEREGLKSDLENVKAELLQEKAASAQAITELKLQLRAMRGQLMLMNGDGDAPGAGGMLMLTDGSGHRERGGDAFDPDERRLSGKPDHRLSWGSNIDDRLRDRSPESVKHDTVASALREKEKALQRLQKEHRELQISSGRSSLARATSPTW